MSIEKEIQDYYISQIKKNRIDFLRVKNNGQKGKSRGHHSNAIFDPPEDNNKYFPDILFCYNGKSYMREFGEAGRHKERKYKQALRMNHWKENGGMDVLTVYDMQTAIMDWQVILKDVKIS